MYSAWYPTYGIIWYNIVLQLVGMYDMVPYHIMYQPYHSHWAGVGLSVSASMHIPANVYGTVSGCVYNAS